MLATVVVLLGFTMPAQPVDRTSAVTPVAAPAPVCDRAAVVNARLDVLDRAGYTWCIGFVPEGNWGLAGYPGPRDITVSETAPCDAIVTIINHEFIHTRQEALYPGRAGRA